MKEPKWVVKKAVPNTDYMITIEFADGNEKVFDARPLLVQPFFEPLKDMQFFMKAHAEYDTVVWTDEIDIAPEYLYENSKEIRTASHVAEETSDYKG